MFRMLITLSLLAVSIQAKAQPEVGLHGIYTPSGHQLNLRGVYNMGKKQVGAWGELLGSPKTPYKDNVYTAAGLMIGLIRYTRAEQIQLAWTMGGGISRIGSSNEIGPTAFVKFGLRLAVSENFFVGPEFGVQLATVEKDETGLMRYPIMFPFTIGVHYKFGRNNELVEAN